MTREEFAYHWMNANNFISRSGEWDWTKQVFIELLGTVYDLQQQINELQEKQNDSYTRDQ